MTAPEPTAPGGAVEVGDWNRPGHIPPEGQGGSLLDLLT